MRSTRAAASVRFAHAVVTVATQTSGFITPINQLQPRLPVSSMGTRMGDGRAEAYNGRE